MNDKASRYRAAVVGSGFGGLAAAIRLQARGVRTVLFEKRDLPGGRAYVYRDQGYTFDAGPTVITAPQCLEELFAAAGRRMSDYVDMLPVRPFYRLSWPDGVAFDYDGDQGAWRSRSGGSRRATSRATAPSSSTRGRCSRRATRSSPACPSSASRTW
jgi:phytoene dehydrogenase-like protein